MDIKLIKLYRGSCYLPQDVIKDRTLHPTSDPQDIKRWWLNAKPEFKEMVLFKRDEDERIEAVGTVVEKLPDVTIFSHQFEEAFNRHSNPQIVPNEDVREIVDLSTTGGRAEIGDMVLVRWVDASHNNTPLTFKEAAKDWEGVIYVIQTGFLIHKNGVRIMLGGRYNEDGKFKYITAIPAENVKSMTKLRRENK